MKNYLNILFVLALFVTTACEDYLEPEPYDFTAPETFYQNPSHAEIALNGIYHVLSAGRVQGQGNNSSFSRDLMEILNAGTDELVSPENNNSRPAQFGKGVFTAQESQLNDSWHYLYAGINRANYLIERLADIPDEDFTGTRKVEIEAEARFLRGFFHMTLSYMYGAIPVYTTSLPDPYAPRSSVQEVYDLVIADFQFAYENLNDRGTQQSHANKWTAAGYLVKAYTYLASIKMNGLSDMGYAKNNFDWVDADAYYTLARDISLDIYTNSGYVLIPNYDYLFRELTKSAQYQEFLFGAEASTDEALRVSNLLVNSFLPQGNATTMGGGSGWLRPLAELYYKYSADDYRRDHNVSGNLGGNRNGRAIETIEGTDYFVPGATNINAGSVSPGKFRCRDPQGLAVPVWSKATTLPLLRYADVLLMRAEALYYTGDEAGARAMLTEVRQRSVIAPATVDDLNTAYFNADFKQELLDERSRELCYEMIRRFDLVRFNVLKETIFALNPDRAYGQFNPTAQIIQDNWSDARVWFPIPQVSLDLNQNLEQNPGY